MIKVLRLGHRRGRDDRISTHVGLVSRQWGASEIVYSGERDKKMMASLEDIIERWGGDFGISYNEDWKDEVRDFDGLKVHLTMYGEKIGEVIDSVRLDYTGEDILVVVGAEKVSRWVYKNVDYNISVGNQPHSEIAALAVFLDRLQEDPIREEFEGADIEVEPSKQDKLTTKK